MNNTRKKKRFSRPLQRGLSTFLAAVMLAVTIPCKSMVKAQENVIEIDSYAKLKAQALFTTEEGGSKNFEGVIIKLTDNIRVPELNDESTENEIAYATCIFGSEENPFKGTFDGNGYTISGLQYQEVWDDPQADTGLFAATDGAVIKNLTIDSADINSDMRGGIVVGYASGTLFDNVTVKNSSLSVAAADNVLLIGTDLGIRGGGIAGQISDSILYNCEVNNCWIRSNNTAGVAALAGKPLTLGGLVGCAEGSTIEYSRVIGDTPYDENAPTGTAASNANSGKTRISIYYDVAVGAVGGNTLYVGGIVGRIWSNNNGNGDKGTAIIDCFSTAEMYYYCATYVSVLGVNVGHIGGITAEVWDDNCSITRCHYAGKATSYQYNALLVIPIIQHDVNISGVADMWRGDENAARRQIYGSFFRESINASNKNAMTTLGDGLTGEISSNGNFGPWSDNLYVTRSAWESFDFDFAGTEIRTSDYNKFYETDGHRNKWVMDYELGIPVHGNSVAATLDFSGAGTVTLSKTELIGQEVSTSDPYTFAVQGMDVNEESLTLAYSSASDKYRLYGWYRFPNVLDSTAPNNHGYFQDLYDRYPSIDVPVYGADGEEICTEAVSNPVSKENSYTPINTVNQPLQWQDNNLFVARIQALVKFHNFYGEVIDKKSGNQNDDTVDDWYFYEDLLPSTTPSEIPGDENTTFLGWTTRVPEQFGHGYTYDATSPATLQELKNNGEFYESGDPITKSMELYPVYAGLASNINTQFEGYMYDSAGAFVEESQQNPAKRSGVGTTRASVDLTGDPTNANVTLSVISENGGDFPTGYRFLGWYEEEHCISREQNPTITGVDLTQKHTYLARFEYTVEYYEKCNFGYSIDSEYADGKKYTEVWHTFEEQIQQIPGLNFANEHFDHWCTDNYQGSQLITENTKVRVPMKVYSYNIKDGLETTKDVDLLNDFPGSGTIVIKYDSLNPTNGKITATPNSGYNFMGWSFENKNYSGSNYNSSGTSNPRETHTAFDANLVYMGHFTADIRFHDISGRSFSTVTRRYQQKLFSEADSYKYPFYFRPSQLTDVSHSYEATPSSDDMNKDGYVFLGWVDGKNLMNADGTLTGEGSYLWDLYVSSGEFLTSNPDKAEPYLLQNNTLVNSTMNLYPVYAKYDITYTTNFEQAGIEETETYNVPHFPVEASRVSNVDGGSYTTTFTVDNDTQVLKNDSSAGKYTVTSVELVNNLTGTYTVLAPDTNGVYTAAGLKPGISYTVVSNYRPMVVVYHQGGATSADEWDISTRAPNSQLGDSPAPLNTADRVGGGYVFLGWTLETPQDAETTPFHKVESAGTLSLVNANTLVNRPMLLWPVYVKTVAVQSNIDAQLTADHQNLTSIRSLGIPNLNVASGNLTAHENATVEDDFHYVFTGWYTGYESDTNPGVQITDNPTLTLSGTDLYASGATYTAVYERAYRVTYHGDEADETVYTVMVPQSVSRSFVETVLVPGDGGTTTSITVPIDTEAFANVERFLESNHVFQEWQYISESGDPQSWESFCERSITKNMDLYPITISATVKDKESVLETSYRAEDTTDPINQNMLEVKVGLGTVQQEGNPVSVSGVSVLVMSEYKQDQLTVSVLKNAYAPSGNGIDVTRNPERQIPVILTLRNNDDLTQNDGEASRLYGTQITDDGGNAVFNLVGKLTVTKVVADGLESRAGETFLMKITVGGQSQTLPLEAGKSLSLSQIPFGLSWSVKEDNDWAWRYEGSVSETGSQITSYHDTPVVTVTNRKIHYRWLDGVAYSHNEFGKGATDGKIYMEKDYTKKDNVFD